MISCSSSIFFFSSAFIFFITFISLTNAADTLTANQSIVDDGKSTIESSGGVFELGFFSPGRSTNRYVGIWYKKISTRTVIWIANRQSPVLDSNSGVLRINKGSLELSDGNNVIWSTNSSSDSNAGTVIVQLLDTGNLVIRNGNDSSNGQGFIWQSFDFPTDNLLQGMKIGWDLDKGLERSLRSWKSNDDPSIGEYTQRVSRNGYPQMRVSKNSVVQFRFGPWDGIQFSGVTFSTQKLDFQLSLVRNDKEIYSSFGITGNSDTVVRYLLLSDGSIQVFSLDDQSEKWEDYLSVQRDACDQYAVCGAYGNCNNTKSRNEAACGCLDGYVPKSPERWRSSNWSDGCTPTTQFDCRNGSDIFVEYSAMKLPDTRTSWFNQTMGLADCKKECLKNCSCTAYSNMDIRQGGTGCLLWFNELLDIRDFKDTGLKFYVRTSASNTEANRGSAKKKGGNGIVIIIAVLVVVAVLIALTVIFLFRRRKVRRRMRRRRGRLALNPQTDTRNDNESKDLELPLFDFQTIANATSNFSLNNKLGEGGFGPVYKGSLGREQEIAVKRLSKTSRQGLDEFKNEVSCIAKLQHRNLVRLLGCCIEHDEMMLIYEYMPNKSLDTFIFDKELSKVLDWPKRYNIIKGIAKDFGLARTFGGNETGVNTVKVVGTYGYMSPEYAIDGFFSVKSDAYSFGVVVLEIVSGNKIRGFFNSDDNLNLLGQAWKVYKEGKILDLVDEVFKESCNESEVLRAVQIGLLCVQPYPKDRPNMRFVVSMLGNDNELPQPTQQPGVFHDRRMQDSDTSSSMQGSSTSNELSITVLNPR
ncbi:Receptor-like serine/threonine-protein kinase [Heracleum sosnowskyi]|uniref:Receptor-like serine/threonine-protein kinase n=1 Tax=Heracleum sosnowskyi TaxID=360622 RepID=A0AAD8HKV4_9APIA|nr:Receptor-like serine/threonine-protein kinase [Heracleum sosnowskyi]